METKGAVPKYDKWKKKYKGTKQIEEENLPEIPPNWCWIHLEVIADVIDPQPSHRTPPKVEGGVPYIGLGDITKDGHINLENARKVSVDVLKEHRSRYQLKEGDFIFGKIGTIGKPVNLSKPYNYTLSANVVLIQPNKTYIIPEYVLRYMESSLMVEIIKRESRATTHAAFGIKKIRIVPFPLPPAMEQIAIISEADRHLSLIKETEVMFNYNSIRADRLRQSILKKAFSGKLLSENKSKDN